MATPSEVEPEEAEMRLVAERDGRLKIGMSLIDVIALGISAAVGVSIFSVMAPAAKVAGPGMLVSLAMAAVPMVIFAVVYAFMGSAVPRSGSSFDWPAQFVHPYLGFIVTWLRIVGNALSLQLMATVFVNYLSQVVAVPARLTMFLLLLVFGLVNLFGVDIAARVGRGLVALKLIALSAFVIAGLPLIRAANFSPFFPHGPWSVLAALPLLVGLYTGIESAAEVGEEIKDSANVIGKGLAAATSTSMLLYFAVSIVALGVLGTSRLAASSAPLLEAGGSLLGKWSTPLFLGTALAAIASAVNATYLIFTRFVFAMGRDGALPSVLADVHPQWGTPYVATIAVFASGVLALLLPNGLIFLFLASNLPTMLKYLSNCLSASRLVDNYPELHARAKFRLTRRAVKWWSYTGIACAVVIIVSGVGADWRPYALLGAWGAIGTAYWFWRAQYSSKSMQAHG